MSFKVRRFLTAVLVLSLLIHIHMAKSGYAAGRPKIAFSSTRDGDSEIYVMDIDGSNPLRLTINPARDYDPSWSPDGEKIAYVRNQAGRQVWVMDADGGNQKRLTQMGKNELPTWSPDGSRIAFVSTRDRVSRIYIMDENGENQESRAQDMAPLDSPSWSPDGGWIAYAATDEIRIGQIHVVKVVGFRRSVRLTQGPPRKLQPAWSPDGNTIAYTSWVINLKRDQKTIHLMTSDGKHLKQLSENHHGNDTDPDWLNRKGWSVSPAANFITTWGEVKQPTLGR